MFAAIKYNLAHLTDFTGREGRTMFWWWVLVVVIINVLVSMALSMTITAGAMATAFEGGKMQNEEAMRAAIMASMLPKMPMLIWTSIVLSLANLVLLGAAFVRRLHDGGFSGWYALIPAAAVLANAWIALDQLSHVQALLEMALEARTPEGLAELQQQQGWKSLMGWVPMLLVAGFGLIKSQAAANRWGEPPLAA